MTFCLFKYQYIPNDHHLWELPYGRTFVANASKVIYSESLRIVDYEQGIFIKIKNNQLKVF